MKLSEVELKQALKELNNDLSKSNFEYSRDIHIGINGFASYAFAVLRQYYIDQRELGFTPCELTFRIWYESKKDEQ